MPDYQISYQYRHRGNQGFGDITLTYTEPLTQDEIAKIKALITRPERQLSGADVVIMGIYELAPRRGNAG